MPDHSPGAMLDTECRFSPFPEGHACERDRTWRREAM